MAGTAVLVYTEVRFSVNTSGRKAYVTPLPQLVVKRKFTLELARSLIRDVSMTTNTMKLPQGGQPQLTGLRAHPSGILVKYMLSEGHSGFHGTR